METGKQEREPPHPVGGGAFLMGISQKEPYIPHCPSHLPLVRLLRSQGAPRAHLSIAHLFLPAVLIHNVVLHVLMVLAKLFLFLENF